MPLLYFLYFYKNNYYWTFPPISTSPPEGVAVNPKMSNSMTK